MHETAIRQSSGSRVRWAAAFRRPHEPPHVMWVDYSAYAPNDGSEAEAGAHGTVGLDSRGRCDMAGATQEQSVASMALQELKLEFQAGTPGDEQELKVTAATVAFVKSKEGKTAVVDGSGNVTWK
jgi:hypothetical protein